MIIFLKGMLGQFTFIDPFYAQNDHQTEESGVNGPLNYDRKTGTDEEDYGIVSEDGPGGDHFDKDQPEVNSDEKPQYEPGVEDGDSDLDSEEEEKDADGSVVIYLVAFVLVCCAVILFGIMAYS